MPSSLLFLVVRYHTPRYDGQQLSNHCGWTILQKCHIGVTTDVVISSTTNCTLTSLCTSLDSCETSGYTAAFLKKLAMAFALKGSVHCTNSDVQTGPLTSHCTNSHIEAGPLVSPALRVFINCRAYQFHNRTCQEPTSHVPTRAQGDLREHEGRDSRGE